MYCLPVFVLVVTVEMSPSYDVVVDEVPEDVPVSVVSFLVVPVFAVESEPVCLDDDVVVSDPVDAVVSDDVPVFSTLPVSDVVPVDVPDVVPLLVLLPSVFVTL